MVVMITIIISIPICFCFDYILWNYCTKRPDFAHWGYKPGSWFSEDKCNYVDHQLQLNSYFHSVKAEQSSDSDIKNQMGKRFDYPSFKSYLHLLSPKLEAEQLLTSVRAFISSSRNNCMEDWHSRNIVPLIIAKLQAIEKYIGINPDGSEVPLSIWDRLRYGSMKNKLVSKISNVRLETDEINEQLMRAGASQQNQRNVILAQCFVLEQFSPWKRYVLNRHYSYLHQAPLTIHPGIWLLSCSFVILSILFLVYWLMQWAVNQGGHNIFDWGVFFSTALFQEAFFIQPIRAFILNSISGTSIKPQLKSIHRILTRNAISCTHQDANRNMHDCDISQYLSPSCRASRLKASNDLAVATLLRSMNDFDICACRDKTNAYISGVAGLILWLPFVASLLDASWGMAIFEVMIPTAFNFFILANYYVFVYIGLFTILPYAFIICYISMYYQYQQYYMKLSQNRKSDDKDGSSSFSKLYSMQGTILRTRDSWLDKVRENAMYIMYDSQSIRSPSDDDDTIASWSVLNLPHDYQGKVSSSLSTSLAGDNYAFIDKVQVSNGISLDDIRELFLPQKIFDVDSMESQSQQEENESKDVNVDDYMSDIKNKFKGHGIISTETAQMFKIKHLITSDPFVALDQMFSRYKYSVNSKQMAMVDELERDELFAASNMDKCDVFAYVKDLTILLKDVWTMYHPYGVQLRDEEVREIMDYFDEWSYKSGKMYGQLRYHMKGRNSLELCIGLRLFHHWFMSACDLVSRYMEQQSIDVNDVTSSCDVLSQVDEWLVDPTIETVINPQPMNLYMRYEISLAKQIVPSIIFDSNENVLINHDMSDMPLDKSLTELGTNKVIPSGMDDVIFFTGDDKHDHDVTATEEVQYVQDDSNQIVTDEKVSITPIDIFALKTIETDLQYDSSDAGSCSKDEPTMNSIEESLRPSEGTEFNSNIKNSSGGDEIPVKLDLRLSRLYKYNTESMWSITNCLNSYNDNVSIATSKDESVSTHPVKTDAKVSTNISHELDKISLSPIEVISTHSKNEQMLPLSRKNTDTKVSSGSMNNSGDRWDLLDAKISDILQYQADDILPLTSSLNHTVQIIDKSRWLTDNFDLKTIETDLQYDSSDAGSGTKDELTMNSIEESLRPSEGIVFNSNIKNSSGGDEIPVKLDLRLSRLYKYDTESMWSITNCLNSYNDNVSIATSQDETVSTHPVKTDTTVPTLSIKEDLEKIEKSVDTSLSSANNKLQQNNYDCKEDSPLLHVQMASPSRNVTLDDSTYVDEIVLRDLDLKVSATALPESYYRTTKPMIKSPVLQVTLIQRLERSSHDSLNTARSGVVYQLSNRKILPKIPIAITKPLSKCPSSFVATEKTSGNTTVQEDLFDSYNSVLLAPRKPLVPIFSEGDKKNQNDNQVKIKRTHSFQRRQFVPMTNDDNDDDDDNGDMREISSEKTKIVMTVDNALVETDATAIQKAPILLKSPNAGIIGPISNKKDLLLIKPANTVSVRSTGNNTEKDKGLSSILFRPPSKQILTDKVSGTETRTSNASASLTGLSPQIVHPKILPNKLVRPPSVQLKGVSSKMDSPLSRNLYLSQVNKNKEMSKFNSPVSFHIDDDNKADPIKRLINDDEANPIKRLINDDGAKAKGDTKTSNGRDSKFSNRYDRDSEVSNTNGRDNEIRSRDDDDSSTKGRQPTPSSVKDMIKLFEPNKTQQHN
jgi:hypothetical protein